MTAPDPAQYDPIAHEYEAHAAVAPYNALYDRPAVLDLLGDVAGRRVLDAGCGNGRFTRACAALGPRRVIGIDPSHSVFAARANTAGLPNATVLQGDIYRLPFPPAHFDHVFCIGVIELNHANHKASYGRFFLLGGGSARENHCNEK